jgi:hypothetical protein
LFLFKDNTNRPVSLSGDIRGYQGSIWGIPQKVRKHRGKCHQETKSGEEEISEGKWEKEPKAFCQLFSRIPWHGHHRNTEVNSPLWKEFDEPFRTTGA